MIARRVPCPLCGEPILQGARKCRGCKRWLVGSADRLNGAAALEATGSVLAPPSSGAAARPARLGPLLLLVAIAAALLVALVVRRESPVGEAPPLTSMIAGSSSAEPSSSAPAASALAASLAAPAASVDDAGSAPAPASAAGGQREWRERRVRVDVHPLDAVFSDDGAMLYVSGDDAKIRAYELPSGKLNHIMAVPAQGDRLRLLAGRYLAVIRESDAAHIPIVDVQSWERDAILLHVGADPADVLALPDGKTVITAAKRGRRLGWFDLASGRELGELRLPYPIDQLYLLHRNDRPYVAALGLLYAVSAAAPGALSDAPSGDQPISASLELFDPSERPFGATRRSVPFGRDPHGGAVSGDGTMLLFADRASNSALLFRTESSERPAAIPVGRAPVAAFILEDRWGVTLDSQAHTATVIDLATAKRAQTLMLPGAPDHGAISPDGKTLFIALGGPAWPPSGAGLAIVAGSPPQVVATRETGAGAGRVAVSPTGARVAVACYAAREVTVLER